MTRESATNQPPETSDEETDILSPADQERVDYARQGILFLNQHLSAGTGDAAAAARPGDDSLLPAAALAMRKTCSFSVNTAFFVSAVDSIALPPSDLNALLDRDKKRKKPLRLHQINLTVSAAGLRLTNSRNGVTCETVIPIADFQTSMEADCSILVALAQVEGIFPARPYGLPYRRSGGPKMQDIDWAKLPDTHFVFDRPHRRLAAYIGQRSYIIEAEPGDPAAALPALAGDAVTYHGLVADMMRNAVKYAGTFSSLGRTDERFAVISIEDGVARGGSPACLSLFQSGMLDGIELHLSTKDLKTVLTLLERVTDFQFASDGDRALIRDGVWKAAIEQPGAAFPDFSAAIRKLAASETKARIRLGDLHLGANIASLLQPRENDRFPSYIDAWWQEGEAGIELVLEGLTPAGHHSRLAISPIGPLATHAQVLQPATMRAAHLKRASVPTDYCETGELIVGDGYSALVLERHGAALTHLLLAPAWDRPARPCAQPDQQTVTADSEPQALSQATPEVKLDPLPVAASQRADEVAGPLPPPTSDEKPELASPAGEAAEGGDSERPLDESAELVFYCPDRLENQVGTCSKLSVAEEPTLCFPAEVAAEARADAHAALKPEWQAS